MLTPNIGMRQTRNLSPRAQDLDRKLAETIDTFRRQYPDTTESDVRHALVSAVASRGSGSSSRVAALAATVGGLVAAGVAVMAVNGGLPDLPAATWAGIAAASLAVIVVLSRLADRS